MAISSEILTDLGIVLITVTGDIDDQILTDGIIAIGEMPGFQPHFHRLTDTTGINGNTVTHEGLARLAEVTPFSHNSKQAFVIADNGSKESIDHFVQLISQDKSGGALVTYSRKEAYDWLMTEIDLLE